MSDCLAASYEPPASSIQILAPASARTCAATPPPAPDPTITTSYVFGLLFTCMRLLFYPQISPTVNPLGNGSPGSTTYCAKPVIQAWPESVGTTAGYGPTRVCSTRRPVNTVPRMPSCTKSSPSAS